MFENVITIQPLRRICWAVRGLSCPGCQAGLCPTFDILFGNVRGFNIFLVDRSSGEIVSEGKTLKGDQTLISYKPKFVDEKAQKILPVTDLVVVPEVLKKDPSPNIKPSSRLIELKLNVSTR